MNNLIHYGDLDRDPGDRVILWHILLLSRSGILIKILPGQNGVHWRSIARLPDLIFDHPLDGERALEDLQNQVKVKPVGFELLPERFTLVICRTCMRLYIKGLWIKGISGKRYCQWDTGKA